MISTPNQFPFWISVYSFCLGAIGGISSVISAHHILIFRGFGGWWRLGFFIASLCSFHQMEFCLTARYHPSNVSLNSYLLNHSKEYKLAILIAIVEFCLEVIFLNFMKQLPLSNIISTIGFILVLIGQFSRSLAMITAQSNFTHNIATEKSKTHKLVTRGIYGVMRHPSYFGFWCWAVGTQMVLLNPISFVGYALFLRSWFSDRIDYEEETLREFFGKEYVEYAKTVKWSGVPFV